jgi:hypothetical protein
MAEPTQRYKYDIRYFKVPDGGNHQCTGNVVSVLSSTYNVNRKTWYLALLVQEALDAPMRDDSHKDTQADWEGGW